MKIGRLEELHRGNEHHQEHMDSGGEALCARESGIETPCKQFTQMIMEMERVRVEKTTRKVTTLSGFTAVAMERGWMMTTDETYVWTHTQEENDPNRWGGQDF